MPDRSQEKLRPTPYGIGLPLFVPGAQPAAGANFTLAVSSAFIQVLRTIRFQLVTDATAANRIVTVDYITGDAVTAVSNGPGVTIAASLTTTLMGKSQLGSGDFATTGSDRTPMYFPLEALMLPGPWLVKITVGNIQAGDQLSAIRMMFDQFTSETFGG